MFNSKPPQCILVVANKNKINSLFGISPGQATIICPSDLLRTCEHSWAILNDGSMFVHQRRQRITSHLLFLLPGDQRRVLYPEHNMPHNHHQFIVLRLMIPIKSTIVFHSLLLMATHTSKLNKAIICQTHKQKVIILSGEIHHPREATVTTRIPFSSSCSY